MTRMLLDDLNRRLCTQYDNPDFIENGYRFWFRGFIDDAETLVGAAVAWPDKFSLRGVRYFACPTNGEPQQYEAGKAWKLPKAPLSTRDLLESGEGAFESAKQVAMDKLRRFVGMEVEGRKPQ